MGNIIMSKQESKQLLIFEKLKRKEITQAIAAQILDLSERWVRTKFRRYTTDGPEGLLHKGRGRPSKKRWSKEQEDQAIELLHGPFKGFGPTFAAEKLAELHSITVSHETLRKSMIRNGLWFIKSPQSKHRRWRERKTCRGIMVQLDGSPHDWFEGRAPKCTLLVFIDDATSEILWAEFAVSESTEALFQATKNYMTKHGIPASFYVDYGGVFSVNTNNPDREKKTQYERAIQELGARVIHASSPQAKGRVERANRTLQDRLVKELRLQKISTMKTANAFVQSGYLDRHNSQFAVLAAEPADAHRSIDGINLSSIFCLKNKRVLQNDFTIAYRKRIFQIEQHQKTILRPKDKIVVREHLDGSISLAIRSVLLNSTEIGKRPPKQLPVKVVRALVHHKPSPEHPRRKSPRNRTQQLSQFR